MRTPATVPAIGAAHGREFIPHEMFVAGAPVATATENPDLIYKVTFLQNLTFTVNAALRQDCKYTLTNFKPLI